MNEIIAAIIGALIMGIFSLISWLYTKYTKKRYLFYTTKYKNLIGSKNLIEQLSLYYEGNTERIKNFSVTTLAFWNPKSNEITKNNYNIKPKIVMLDSESEILGYKKRIQYEESHVNADFTVVSSREIEFNFDILYENHGVVIDIYHTSTKRETIEIKVELGNIKSKKVKITPYKKLNVREVLYLILGLLIPIMFLSLISPPSFTDFKEVYNYLISAIFSAISGFMSVVYIVFVIRRRYILPEKFREYINVE